MKTISAPISLEESSETSATATSTSDSSTTDRSTADSSTAEVALAESPACTTCTATAVSAECPEAPPKHPRTEAQAEASRRNGAKSGGPKTAAGKAVSRLNAVRHGLLAEKLRPISNWRNEDCDYEHFLDGIKAQYGPQTIIEHNLAELLAHDFLLLGKNKHLQACFMTPVEANERTSMMKHPVDLARKRVLAELILEDLDADASMAYLPDHAQDAARQVTKVAQRLIDEKEPSREHRKWVKAIAQARKQGLDTTDDDAVEGVLTGSVSLSGPHRTLLATLLTHSLKLIELAENCNASQSEQQKLWLSKVKYTPEQLHELDLCQRYEVRLWKQIERRLAMLERLTSQARLGFVCQKG